MRRIGALAAALILLAACSDTTDTTGGVSKPTTTLAAVGALSAGLTCRDVADLGYSYEDAVAYWARERQPDPMDLDGNGIPCDAIYDRVAVAAFWGEPLPTTSLPRFDVIGDVPAGMHCRDLTAMGIGYVEAVAYWMREGMPERMDTDANGVPCETEYPAPSVEELYGASAALDVHLVTTVGETPVPRFVATGPAVDAGIICPAGTADWVGGHDSRWEDEYVCDDGSGTFIAGADIHIAGDRLYESWSIMSGTGEYGDLTGGGGADTGPARDGLWQDHMYGRVERDR